MYNDEPFSVIISAFNAAHTLGETLDSVRSETHRRLEIIVVDDGSHDRAAEIAEVHAAEDGRIRLIRKEKPARLTARMAALAALDEDFFVPAPLVSPACHRHERRV